MSAVSLNNNSVFSSSRTLGSGYHSPIRFSEVCSSMSLPSIPYNSLSQFPLSFVSPVHVYSHHPQPQYASTLLSTSSAAGLQPTIYAPSYFPPFPTSAENNEASTFHFNCVSHSSPSSQLPTTLGGLFSEASQDLCSPLLPSSSISGNSPPPSNTQPWSFPSSTSATPSSIPFASSFYLNPPTSFSPSSGQPCIPQSFIAATTPSEVSNVSANYSLTDSSESSVRYAQSVGNFLPSFTSPATTEAAAKFATTFSTNSLISGFSLPSMQSGSTNPCIISETSGTSGFYHSLPSINSECCHVSSPESVPSASNTAAMSVAPVSVIRGVTFDEKNKRWGAHWVEDGVKFTKYFSLLRYGDAAYAMAVNCRFNVIKSGKAAQKQGVTPVYNSGKKGVTWRERVRSWVATWYEQGKQKHKYFSEDKFGFERAKINAIAYRTHQEEQQKYKRQAAFLASKKTTPTSVCLPEVFFPESTGAAVCGSKGNFPNIFDSGLMFLNLSQPAFSCANQLENSTTKFGSGMKTEFGNGTNTEVTAIKQHEFKIEPT